jgi:hypothetical protein
MGVGEKTCSGWLMRHLSKKLIQQLTSCNDRRPCLIHFSLYRTCGTSIARAPNFSKQNVDQSYNILEEDKETQKPRYLVFNVNKTGLPVVQNTVVEIIAHNAKRQIAPLA